MSYGGIDFGHVWAFQIKCMMANQYPALVEVIDNYNNDSNKIFAICLRLSWNDAFRHVSENNSDPQIIANYKKANIGKLFNNTTKITDTTRDKIIFELCEFLVPYLKRYMVLSNTPARLAEMDRLTKDPAFCNIVGVYKNLNSQKNPFCVGHIQKLFNMTIKLLICLIISAEQADSIYRTQRIKVKLGENSAGRDVLLTSKNWWKDDEFDFFKENSFNADCPLDSKILDKIGKPNIKWSKIGNSEPLTSYSIAQKEIEQIYNGTGKCNLCFDFENWN